MALVLCTGDDRTLINARRFILESAGHKVVIGMGEPAVTAACKEHKFDVAVIGQSGEKKQIMAIVRQHCPFTKVLELYPPYEGRVLHDADLWLEVPVNIPAKLAETVNALAVKSRKPS
jgi:hypothetical protein